MTTSQNRDILGEAKSCKEFMEDHKFRGYTQSWIGFVKSIRAIPGKDILYHPINHPWFDGWEILRTCEDRINMIDIFAKSSGVKTIVDLGCHHGYIAHELTRKGFSVVGVDVRESSIVAAKILNKIYGMECPFILSHIKSYNPDMIFDLALLLGTHHHIESSEGYEGLINVLKHMGTFARNIIIEVALADEELNRKNRVNQYTIESEMNNLGWKSKGILGTMNIGRLIYLFIRENII